MATLGSLIVNVLANTSGFAKAMNGAIGTLGRLKATATTVHGSLGKVEAVIGAIGAGATIYHLKSVAEEMDNVAKVSDRLGITTESLIGLQYGAGLAGVSSEGLASSMQFMTKQIGEAIHGSGKAKVVFDELGISVNSLAEMAPEKQLMMFAEQINAMGSEAEKTRAAMRLFGGDGAAMLSFLAEGEAGIKSYMKEAKAFGLTYSREEAAKVEEFNDAWDKLSKTLGGISKDIVIKIAPEATKAIDGLREAVAGFKIRGKDGQTILDREFPMTQTIVGKTLRNEWGIQKWMTDRMIRADVANEVGAGAFTAAELGAMNAARFQAFANGPPATAAAEAIGQKRIGQAASELINKFIVNPISDASSEAIGGLRKADEFLGTAKDFGKQWQKSWLLKQVFPQDGPWDRFMREREKERADKAKDAIERRTEGFNTAVEAGTPEALRAIALSREQNRMIDRMVAEQRKTNDQARQQTNHLAVISKKLNLETTGLN